MSEIGWRTVQTVQDAEALMHAVDGFHDSCLKELRYVSGAYMTRNGMSPTNDRRVLFVMIETPRGALELAFSGLQTLRLSPATPDYTCEILDASLFVNDDGVVWCDSALSAQQIDFYDGTVICADALRYRLWNGPTGKADVYASAQR